MRDEIQKIAQDLNYQRFTTLQEAAFQNPDVYCEDKDIFVIGQTSSGKTLIPLLLFYRRVLDADAHAEPRPRMLFAVPYRALAAQKKRELENFFRKLRLTVALSTAEYRESDDEIRSGSVDVAVIINEKVYKFATQEEGFLSKYDYLVLDEVGLIGDSERGMKLDFLISWTYARRIRYSKPRMILLGTPCYNWEAYYKEFRFSLVSTEERPVPLTECLIQYDRFAIKDVEPKLPWLPEVYYYKKRRYETACRRFGFYGTPCDRLPEGVEVCSVDEPCRKDTTLPCLYGGGPCTSQAIMMPEHVSRPRDYALYEICAHHLALGHQILIFINDRHQVRAVCKNLYQALKDQLPPAPDVQTYKREMLASCNLEEDDVYGVMEDLDADESERNIYYEAFSHGIGFHSAATPNELRNYIERALLEDGKLRIVCSTETLAFGVNSNVDVVIIADLQKPGNSNNGIDRMTRILSANEYRNYIGRAGRLSRFRKAEDSRGYVYTMLHTNEMAEWRILQEEAEKPAVMHSLLFKNDDNILSFFILNLLSDEGYPVDSLIENIGRIPRPEGYSLESLREEMDHALSFLQANRLIRNPPVNMARRTDNRKEFCLTAMGACLKGFIIGEEDYLIFYEALQTSIAENLVSPIDEISILYTCLHTKHAERSIKNLGFENAAMDDKAIYEDIRAIQQERNLGEPAWLRAIGKRIELGALSPADRKRFRILAALVAWTQCESPKRIYVQYGIHYSLIAKVSVQICYLLEIARAIMPRLLDQAWERLNQRRNIGAMLRMYDWDSVRAERLEELHRMYVSLFFGIDARTWMHFAEFLDRRPDEEVAELRETFACGRINPVSARQLRKLCIRHRFFSTYGDHEPEDPMEKMVWKDRRRQYIADIHALGDPYLSFFREDFGDRWDRGRDKTMAD